MLKSVNSNFSDITKQSKIFCNCLLCFQNSFRNLTIHLICYVKKMIKPKQKILNANNIRDKIEMKESLSIMSKTVKTQAKQEKVKLQQNFYKMFNMGIEHMGMNKALLYFMKNNNSRFLCSL